MSTSEVISRVRLAVGAQDASPKTVSKALAQKLDPKLVPEFCKAFNAKTAEMAKGTSVRCLLKVLRSGGFEVVIRTAHTSDMIKKAAGLENGSSTPGRGDPVARISLATCQEIAKAKQAELSAYTLDKATAIVQGVVKSMGVVVEQ